MATTELHIRLRAAATRANIAGRAALERSAERVGTRVTEAWANRPRSIEDLGGDPEQRLWRIVLALALAIVALVPRVANGSLLAGVLLVPAAILLFAEIIGWIASVSSGDGRRSALLALGRTFAVVARFVAIATLVSAAAGTLGEADSTGIPIIGSLVGAVEGALAAVAQLVGMVIVLGIILVLVAVGIAGALANDASNARRGGTHPTAGQAASAAWAKISAVLLAVLTRMAPHALHALRFVVVLALGTLALWIGHGLRGLKAAHRPILIVGPLAPVQVLVLAELAPLYRALNIVPSGAESDSVADRAGRGTSGDAPKEGRASRDEAAVVALIRKALVQSIGDEAAKRYAYRTHTQTFDVDAYEFRATERDDNDANTLERGWLSAAKSVQRQIGDKEIGLVVELGPTRYVVNIPRPLPEFPAMPATSLAAFIDDHRAELAADRLGFAIGLDWQSRPVWLRYDDATPSFLIAGGQGSGKLCAWTAPLAQLMASNTPKQLQVTAIDSTKREVSALLSGSPYLARPVVVATEGDTVVQVLGEFAASMDAWYAKANGRKWSITRDPIRLLIVEEWADLRDLLDKDQVESVTKSIKRINQTGRAAGYRVVLVTQRAAVETVPGPLKAVLKGRICGYFAAASDYGTVMDEYQTVKTLPNIQGRLLVKTASGELVQVQGLYADDRTLRGLLTGEAVGGSEEAEEDTIDPAIAEGDEPDTDDAPQERADEPADESSTEALPPLPRQSDLSAGDAMAAAAVLLRAGKRAGDTVSRTRLRDAADTLGLKVGNDAAMAALRGLEQAGIVAPHPSESLANQGTRALAIDDWEEIVIRLVEVREAA